MILIDNIDIEQLEKIYTKKFKITKEESITRTKNIIKEKPYITKEKSYKFLYGISLDMTDDEIYKIMLLNWNKSIKYEYAF